MQLPQFQAHADLEDRHWWFTARRRILLTLLKELVPPSPDRFVVDVGCGTGGNTAAVAKSYACIGVDPDTNAVTFARQKYPALTFIQGYAPADVKSEMLKADAVLLMDVLEHIEHDKAFVEDLLKSMKPGAFLFLMAPADPSLWSPHDAGFEHFRRYTLESFRALWKDAPAKERLASYCNRRLYPLVKLMRTLAKLRGKSLGQGSTDLSMPMKPVNVFLHELFADEDAVLLKTLRGKRKRGYRKGVSVFGVLERA